MDSSDTFIKKLLTLHKEVSACPPPARIIRFFDALLGTIFPEFSENRLTDDDSIRHKLTELKSELRTILNQNEECVQSKKASIEDLIFDELPDIHQMLLQDVEAIYKGDPAAKSQAEVIRTYPGFYAIAAHRNSTLSSFKRGQSYTQDHFGTRPSPDRHRHTSRGRLSEIIFALTTERVLSLEKQPLLAVT